MPIRVIIDRRERNQELIDALIGLGIEPEVATLDIGDYIISDRLCIERKTVSDFEKSIMDGRLFDQIERMKNSYELPIIVLEGNTEEFKLKHNVINGTIISIYSRYGIPILMSNSPSDTAEIILTTAKQEQNGIREPTRKNGRKAFTNQEYMENVIANMPGIGPKLSRQLLKHFGSIEAIAHSDIKELCKVDKIGKKKAARIKEILNGNYF